MRIPVSSSLLRAANSALCSFLVCNSSILLATSSLLRNRGAFWGLDTRLRKCGLSCHPARHELGKLFMSGIS